MVFRYLALKKCENSGQMGLIMTGKRNRCTRNLEILSEKNEGARIKTLAESLTERSLTHMGRKADTGGSLWTLTLFLISYEERYSPLHKELSLFAFLITGVKVPKFNTA